MRTSDTDRLLARLCRSSPQEARDLSLGLPETARAQFALFCYARTHLRQVGQAIATACSEASLLDEGGAAGRALFRQAYVGTGGPAKRVTLASRAEPLAA